ncbi:MAG: 3-phenylpropionate/trans-cinnamate dioxygenase ferredoxin component [Pseudonocardiales bacterium]|jgi:nitrite reductase/ring-hydroxylating ferredoxin subunit|nr:3-phenylpropionate/trans-cinnamate dioxygenase ferredoxin component [Pseudonocardiales bacterium]
MSGFVKVASLSSLTDDSAVQVTIGHVQICLAKTQGEVLAVRDECSHAEVSLSDGEVEDGSVECWLHGSKFDLRTGAPTGLPATEPVPVFPVRIDGDDIYVAVKE